MSRQPEIITETLSPPIGFSVDAEGLGGLESKIPATDEQLLAYGWLQAANDQISDIKSRDNDRTELDLLDELQVKLDILDCKLAEDEPDCIYRLADLAAEAGLDASCGEINRSMVECQLQMLMQVVLMQE